MLSVSVNAVLALGPTAPTNSSFSDEHATQNIDTSRVDLERCHPNPRATVSRGCSRSGIYPTRYCWISRDCIPVHKSVSCRRGGSRTDLAVTYAYAVHLMPSFRRTLSRKPGQETKPNACGSTRYREIVH
ncbi:hypothetical protein PENSPDRAFT_500650 [Peniophora sp. CONT]|nr:hypothetical protein PENSPDRAFT_500650 [Peniophora sp. CONT]